MRLPDLKLSEWQSTRDTLQQFSQVLGTIRQNLTTKTKHWMHINLRPDVRGLTTPVIPVDGKDKFGFKLQLDLLSHQCQIKTSKGTILTQELSGQSSRSFYNSLRKNLDRIGVRADLNAEEFSDKAELDYDPEAVVRYQQAMIFVAMVFEEFKSGLREETSTLNLWPHHFDLAFLWFSGRLVPGEDPQDEESADEQIAFGFSTGDEGIPEAYFYFTAYPWQEAIKEARIPSQATWQSNSWDGALLMYDALVKSEDPKRLLLDYMQSTFDQSKKLMQK